MSNGFFGFFFLIGLFFFSPSFQKKIVNFLNQVFGNTEESKTFWETTLKQALIQKFNNMCEGDFEDPKLDFKTKFANSFTSERNEGKCNDGRCKLFQQLAKVCGEL